MNHDYEHCLDFERNCPKECFRAQLVRDLSVNIQYREISWMHFKGGVECLKTRKDGEVDDKG